MSKLILDWNYIKNGKWSYCLGYFARLIVVFIVRQYAYLYYISKHCTGYWLLRMLISYNYFYRGEACSALTVAGAHVLQTSCLYFIKFWPRRLMECQIFWCDGSFFRYFEWTFFFKYFHLCCFTLVWRPFVLKSNLVNVMPLCDVLNYKKNIFCIM